MPGLDLAVNKAVFLVQSEYGHWNSYVILSLKYQNPNYIKDKTLIKVLSGQITPHSYINLPPIDKLPPTLTTKWEDFKEDIWPGYFIILKIALAAPTSISN